MFGRFRFVGINMAKEEVEHAIGKFWASLGLHLGVRYS
jgi:hypothetical protein